MWGTVGSILSSFLKVGLEFLQGWYAENKAKEHEWAHRTLEFQQEEQRKGLEKQRELEGAGEDPALSSVEEFNKRFSQLLLLAALLLLPGCFVHRVPVHSYVPVPPRLEPLILEATDPGDQVLILINAYSKLEKTYLRVRQEAIDSNLEHGYPPTWETQPQTLDISP